MFAHTLYALTAVISVAAAQTTTASDADVAQVGQQIENVSTAADSLDDAVLAYTGPTDTLGLQAASNNVVLVLNDGTTFVDSVPGVISVNQGVTLVDPVNALNTVVNRTATDAINARALFVTSCIGPTILAALQEQLAASNAFAQAIANKVDPSIYDLALSLAQPSVDSLNQAIRAYSDQTSLPPACLSSSTSASTIVISTAPDSSSVNAITTALSSSGLSSTSASANPVVSATPSSFSSGLMSGAATVGRSISGSACAARKTRSASLTTYTSTVTCSDGHVTTTTVTLCNSACRRYPYVTTSTCPNGSVTTYTVTPRQFNTSSLAASTKPALLSVTTTAAGTAVGSTIGTATVPTKPPSYTGGAGAIAAEFNALALLGVAAVMVL